MMMIDQSYYDSFIKNHLAPRNTNSSTTFRTTTFTTTTNSFFINHTIKVLSRENLTKESVEINLINSLHFYFNIQTFLLIIFICKTI